MTSARLERTSDYKCIFQVEIDAKQVLSPFLVTLELQGVIEADFSLDTHVRFCENTCQTALQVNLQ